MQKLDFENPNEQNFILLVVATEEQTEARLSSSATLRVQVHFIELSLQSFYPLLKPSLPLLSSPHIVIVVFLIILSIVVINVIVVIMIALPLHR